MRLDRKGFTIVELLIVIVVLGILAALVTAGTGRYQRNARNQSKIVAAQSLSGSLRTYLGEFNKYPMDESTCLGYGDDYSEDGDFCFIFRQNEIYGGSPEYRVREEFNRELAKVTTDPRPKVDTSLIGGDPQIGGGIEIYLRGVHFIYNKPTPPSVGGFVDGKDHWYFLAYTLEGDAQDCGAKVVRYVPPDLSSYVSTNDRYSFTDNGWTYCAIPLPDPVHPDSGAL